MGRALRRIRKSLPKIAMVDAHVAINGCQVFLGHPDPDKATASAKGFQKMLSVTIARAKCLNVSDMYNASFMVRDRVLNGEPIWN